MAGNDFLGLRPTSSKLTKGCTDTTWNYWAPLDRTCPPSTIPRFNIHLYRNVGSSNPEGRSQICGRGLPLHQSPPSESYVTHYWRPQNLSGQSCGDSPKLVDLTQYQTATLFESRRIIESGTTGLRTWRASFILAQYLIRHPGEHVLAMYV